MDITICGVAFKVDVGAHENFWQRCNSGEWEPETFEVFERYLTPETTFIDLGAWIGPTSLYAARKVRRVISFEPDPVAYAELKRNTALNPDIDNITILNAAVGVENGSLTLGFHNEPGDSMSSLLLGGEGGITVPVVRLDEVIASLDVHPPMFLKVDIEGYEYELFPRIMDVVSAYGATMHLSTHSEMVTEPTRRKIGNSSVLSRLHQAIYSRTTGRITTLRSNARLACGLHARGIVMEEDGTEINLFRLLTHVARGRDLTTTRTLLVTAR